MIVSLYVMDGAGGYNGNILWSGSQYEAINNVIYKESLNTQYSLFFGGAASKYNISNEVLPSGGGNISSKVDLGTAFVNPTAATPQFTHQTNLCRR